VLSVQNEVSFEHAYVDVKQAAEKKETVDLDSDETPGKTYEVGPWSVGEANAE
jgi:hypothetical protein